MSKYPNIRKKENGNWKKVTGIFWTFHYLVSMDHAQRKKTTKKRL